MIFELCLCLRRNRKEQRYLIFAQRRYVMRLRDISVYVHATTILEQLLSHGLRNGKMESFFFSLLLDVTEQQRHKLKTRSSNKFWSETVFRFYFIVRHDAAITRQHKPLIVVRLRELFVKLRKLLEFFLRKFFSPFICLFVFAFLHCDYCLLLLIKASIFNEWFAIFVVQVQFAKLVISNER